MEPITFIDTLVHYRLKLAESLGYLRETASGIDSALDCAASSWKGQASDAFRIKLEDLKIEIDKAETALENADAMISQALAAEQAII